MAACLQFPADMLLSACVFAIVLAATAALLAAVASILDGGEVAEVLRDPAPPGPVAVAAPVSPPQLAGPLALTATPPPLAPHHPPAPPLVLPASFFMGCAPLATSQPAADDLHEN